MKKKPSKKAAPPPAAKPAPRAKPAPPAPMLRLPPGFPALPADDAGESGKRKLNKQQIDAIRLLAITMAGPDLGDDAVMICNPITEEPALPVSELLYDTCKWCDVDIYYDRLMPSPPGMMRVCVKCGIMLLEAEKKGAN
jgi:hypothetical protein